MEQVTLLHLELLNMTLKLKELNIVLLPSTTTILEIIAILKNHNLDMLLEKAAIIMIAEHKDLVML